MNPKSKTLTANTYAQNTDRRSAVNVLYGCDPGQLAVVIAAHGDLGSREASTRNQAIKAHAGALERLQRFRAVVTGVLKGEPSIETALANALQTKPEAIAIYPFFMSDGYFVRTVLVKRLAEASTNVPTALLEPLGHDPGLPALMRAQALETATNNGFDAAASRLLVAGHGSKYGPASANATRSVAAKLAALGGFAEVETAFLEEAPFLEEQLQATGVATLVSGFFNGNGLHAGEDVPQAIAKCAPETAIYTGPIGAHARIPEIISNAVLGRLSDT